MNIFVLDSDPKIAASMHCDQHLHKMILESAQMLSTIASVCLHSTLFKSGNYYKPTHGNHPCTLWVTESPKNMLWLVRLCHELDDMRQYMGHSSHASMEIVRQFEEDFGHLFPVNPMPESFIFCGPALVQYNRNLTVPEKYQQFYRVKRAEWESAGRKMTWNGRAVPEFMNGEI